MDRTLLRQLLGGLAAGDALGATSEFSPGAFATLRLRRDLVAKGIDWPFAVAGGGAFCWKPGEPTDDTDMAMCIIRACRDGFNVRKVADEFCVWRGGAPRDIGGTTRSALEAIIDGESFETAGRTVWAESGYKSAANGALMRNGIIPGICDDSIEQSYSASLASGIITHCHPLSVLTCAAQVWWLWELFEERWPFEREDWCADFHKSWTEWFTPRTEQPGIVQRWYQGVGDGHLADAWETLWSILWSDPKAFDPLHPDAIQHPGYCLTTLQVALWALYWSHADEAYPVRSGTRVAVKSLAGVLAKRGIDCLGWPAIVGKDADTYGAVAGPLIVAAHGGELPEALAGSLQALKQFDEFWPAPVEPGAMRIAQ